MTLLTRPHIRGLQSYPGDKTRMYAFCQCPICQDREQILVSVDGAKAYDRGALIQDAMPELNTHERERLMTGICGTCWESL